MPGPSKAFISYSHDSPAHQNTVLKFATRLVTEGVDAKLDQWVDDPEGGWPFWTERQVAESDFVVLVCTEIFRKRVEVPDYQAQAGAGVFWEANIIRSQLYGAKGHDRRFLPVYFGVSGREWIPDILQGVTSYQIDTPDGYTSLYRRLTGQPEVERPELGRLVVLPRTQPSDDRAKEAVRPSEHESSLSEPVSFKTLQPLPNCDEKHLKSIEGSVPAFIRFDNYLKEDINLYWLNYNGVRVLYAELETGRSHVQETYVTHPWVVTKKDASSFGNAEPCLAIFQPESEPGVAEITQGK